MFSNDGNPLETGSGAVSKDKKTQISQLGDAMVFGEECFTSARVNHVLRVTEPNYPEDGYTSTSPELTR
jgi:hypothetical protein